MRYAEQFLQELPLELPAGDIDAAAAEDLAQRFDAEYARLYGEGARAIFHAVEVFTVRVTARVPLGFAPHPEGDGAGPSGPLAGEHTRKVFWPAERAWIDTAVHDGATLSEGATVEGPAVVELPLTAVSVPAGTSLRRDGLGNLHLTSA
jgi:N-methylhydantoinase A